MTTARTGPAPAPETWTLRATPAEPPAASLSTRYDRQARIEGWSQEVLGDAHVLVVGAGAVGNEVLAQLALMGVGTITVCDPDRIEASNLARTVLFRPGDLGENKAEAAAGALRAMNPDVTVHALPGRLERMVGAGLVHRTSLAIGCVDNLQTRVRLNRLCLLAHTPWIDTGIDARAAQVQLIHPGTGACFECTLPSSARRRLAARYRCADRLLRAARERVVPTVAPVAVLAGAIAAREAVAWLHAAFASDGAGPPAPPSSVLAPAPPGTRIYLDSATWRITTSTARQRRARCTAHHPPVLATPLPVDHQATLKKLAEAVAQHTSWGALRRLTLDEPWVQALTCERCGASVPVRQPRDDVPTRRAHCPCGAQRTADLAQALDVDHHPDTRLFALGIAPEAWLWLEGAHGSGFAALTPGQRRPDGDR